MKMRFPSFALLFVFLLLTMGISAAQAQTSPARPGSMILVSFYRFNNGTYSARFDTDGQTVGGLTAKALFDKFFQTSSVAGVLNFVTQAGYWMLSFSPVQGHVSPGTGGGDLEGYAVLFERVAAPEQAGETPRR